MKGPSFESASGLRPATAYLMIGAVMVLVIARAWVLVGEERGQERKPSREVTRVLNVPDFDIVDSEGRELAMSVQRMDLALSPRAMWQAHTPLKIATRIAPFLEDEDGQPFTVDELLDLMLPTEEQSGWISISREGWRLDFEMAGRVREWIAELGLEQGFDLVRESERPIWDLWWCPEYVLSEEVRNPHGSGTSPELSAWKWGIKLADGLGQAMWPELEVYRKKANWEDKTRQRELVWRALMPCAEALVCRDIPPAKVKALIAALEHEKVRRHQMRVDFEHERLYPVCDSTGGKQAFEVLGGWRHISEDEALAGALAQYPDEDAQSLAKRDALRRELLERKFPRSGLEGAAGRLLAQESMSYIAPQAASYTYMRNRSALEGSRSYFRSDLLEGHTPVVHSTIDARLQGFLREQLIAATKDNKAALSMGIVVDVATGDVLAADGLSEPALWEYLPTWHLFTPGSTFKVIVMATALDDGKVEYNEEFDTHNGHYFIPGSRREIKEARGAPTGVIEAWEALAFSVNAVMVQIGMRVDDEHFAQKLELLGYSKRPNSGVGTERRGSIPGLPWRASQSHASVCFGHEVLVSLWQHAAGLATVMRGGEYLPLRMIDGVEWNGELRPLPLAEPVPVFSREACDQVRMMMRRGAEIGTGRHINGAEEELGTPIRLLSKTGTTEKKDTEPCLHLDLERNAQNLGKQRKDPAFVTFKQMMASQMLNGPPHERTCYTSSICLVGKVVGEERELMTLIVIEEPTGKNKFGSDVAGPTAIAVLKEALGLTQGGAPVASFANLEVDYGYVGELGVEGDDHPWAYDEELGL